MCSDRVIQSAEGIWEEKQQLQPGEWENGFRERTKRRTEDIPGKGKNVQRQDTVKEKDSYVRLCRLCTAQLWMYVWGGIHIAVYVQYGGPVRGQGKFGE